MSNRDTTHATSEGHGSRNILSPLTAVFKIIPNDLIALLARIVVGLVFWKSGQTKVDGFTIKEKTFDLFRDIYKVPLIPPDIAAYMATIAEHLFPILLWVGLATRLSAAALLIMTLVIQTFVFPQAYVTHGLWAVALLFLMAHGAGVLSLDHLVFGSRESGVKETSTMDFIILGLFILIAIAFAFWMNF